MTTIDLPGLPPIHLARTGPRGQPPLVFIHGVGMDLTWWDHQFEHFGAAHDVAAFDLPGHGLSGALDGPASFDRLARVLEGVLAHVGPGPAHVVGLSVGGMIAQTLAVQRPELFHSLSLVGTACSFNDALREVLRTRARVSREQGMAAITPLSLERWFPPACRERRPDLLARAAKSLLQQDAQAHASLWDMISGLDLSDKLSAIRCPTQVIVGEKDVNTPRPAGQRIADQIAGAVLHEMKGCGHLPQAEAPAEFNRLLAQFLARVG